MLDFVSVLVSHSRASPACKLRSCVHISLIICIAFLIQSHLQRRHQRLSPRRRSLQPAVAGPQRTSLPGSTPLSRTTMPSSWSTTVGFGDPTVRWVRQLATVIIIYSTCGFFFVKFQNCANQAMASSSLDQEGVDRRIPIKRIDLQIWRGIWRYYWSFVATVRECITIND